MIMPTRADEYENGEPIADELVVLDLLYTDRWEWKVERRLWLPNQRSLHDVPYVSVRWNEYRVSHFLIARGVGERLLYRGLLEGKKHWGHTDDHDLSITEEGKQLVRETYEKIGVPFDPSFSSRLRSDRWYQEVRP